MDIQGEKILTAPREQVWRALNDPAVLQRCLAGCDTFEVEGENKFKVAMQATVGPIRARFSGKLQLLDLVPASSYALTFEGSGGAAGFGKGSARVMLDDVAGGTRLRYTAQAQVGGRLSQVGARLIDGVTQRMADEFFSRFVKDLAALEPASSPSQALDAPAMNAAPDQPSALEAKTSAPAPVAQPMGSPQPPHQVTQIAVIAAAVAATAAAVAVLAAVVALQMAR